MRRVASEVEFNSYGFAAYQLADSTDLVEGGRQLSFEICIIPASGDCDATRRCGVRPVPFRKCQGCGSSCSRRQEISSTQTAGERGWLHTISLSYPISGIIATWPPFTLPGEVFARRFQLALFLLALKLTVACFWRSTAFLSRIVSSGPSSPAWLPEPGFPAPM